jgi:NAD+ synthase (glutamine-hydrolysing)
MLGGNKMLGFVRVAAAVPKLKVADCHYNTLEILNSIEEAKKNDIKVLVFPELCITAYTCADLFFQQPLLAATNEALESILENTRQTDMLIAIGMPIAISNQLFNCAVLINKGKILGAVPKTYIPNYSEFYEKRWFSSSFNLSEDTIHLCNQDIPVGTDLLFVLKDNEQICVGAEICEDLWAPIPPSSYASINGANIIINLSASNETISKSQYRRDLVGQQSARCLAAYIYCSAGCDESTTDIVFGGHSIIAENGSVLSESERFSQHSELIYKDIDVQKLNADRKKSTSFMEGYNTVVTKKPRKIVFDLTSNTIDSLERFIDPFPFVPTNESVKSIRCEEIFSIQVAGLAKRIKHIHSKSIVLGISGGLDSTLALLVCVKTCDYLGLSRKSVIGITMPGFGTTDRTYTNAINLMKALGVTIKEISIKQASMQHFEDIGHDPTRHDLTYENTQARERTQILMDVASMTNGFVVGTGDLSELALGWATYNGDHMSMYGVNCSIPKTLVRSLVYWISQTDFVTEAARDILIDVLDTPVSPELLPPDENGQIHQITENLVGPYELHDFFLYYMVRFGFSPTKILYLTQNAFKEKYSRDIILKWLNVFYRRFFTQQFKRSCLPDGPKVGSICLSPRGDWRMPSDACYTIWMKELENL